MAFRRSAALIRQDLRILRRDPVFFLVFLLMPLLLIAFIKPILRPVLAEDGEVGANGAEQAVPGIAVMFALFLVGQVGWGFFREHGWNTWDRLRASAATPAEVLLGKAVLPFLQLLFYMAFVFAVGALVFDLRVDGDVLAVALVASAFALMLVTLAFVLVAVCSSAMQLNAITNLGTLLLAGLGGALSPHDDLPDWAQTVAPATPTYWAMRGFREAILDGGGVAQVAGPVLVLLAFAAGFAALAAFRFRYDEAKTSWA